MGDFPNKATQFKPGNKGGPKGLTKAQKMGKIIDMVLGVPCEDITAIDGKTNFAVLQEKLQEAFREKPIDYLLKLWGPIAELTNKARIEIDVRHKAPLQINFNGMAPGKVVDAKPDSE